ncbi:hypothetical protein TNCV_3082681 [Trichonephila clavipes]|nr:hypothetical protein TNCV_3082681 [Trichonephila clavipes]
MTHLPSPIPPPQLTVIFNLLPLPHLLRHLPNKIQILDREKEIFKKLDEAKIEIKMAPHKTRKSAPVEYTTDEEDIIVYDVEEDEIEKKPADDFVLPEFFRKNPHEYVRALTPTRYSKRS